MKQDIFTFKQFKIAQERCAMKIGTDGVLLGAWTSLKTEPNTLLDIGAGTGVIALMLAQRCGAETIDAIEIDPDAYEQCVTNFETSPWADRLFCYHSGLEEFAEEMEGVYDLIVSNPPFHSEINPSRNRPRTTARQNKALPFKTLLEGVTKLLAADGSFSTILPWKESEAFVTMASDSLLYPQHITQVKGTPTSPVKRVLMEFGRQNKNPRLDMLIIETRRHHYTDEYIALTKDFYLKM